MNATVEIVRSLYDAFSRGDIAYILEKLSPDCQWIAPGAGIPTSGRYIGPAGAREFFVKLNASEEILRLEVSDLFTNPAGDVVAQGVREARVRANGRVATTNWMMLFRFRDGLVTHFESFYDTAAYAAAHRG